MNFRESLGTSVNSLIKNYAPFGVFGNLVAAYVAFLMVGKIWPDLGRLASVLTIIVVAIVLSLAGFVVLASVRCFVVRTARRR